MMIPPGLSVVSSAGGGGSALAGIAGGGFLISAGFFGLPGIAGG